MYKSIIAIAIGSAIGAVLRWGLAIKLNHLLTHLPLGTLAANLLGGWIIGLALACFLHTPSLSPEWRLFIITGFCGGLTTFSTFSAEVIGLFQQREMLWAFATVGAHLAGSLFMTALGMMSWNWMRNWV